MKSWRISHSNIGEKKWPDKHIDFQFWYKKLLTCLIIPRKVLDFNWRVFHGQIVTEKRLMKMKLSNGQCKLCEKGIEDVQHLFVDCPYSKCVWSFASCSFS